MPPVERSCFCAYYFCARSCRRTHQQAASSVTLAASRRAAAVYRRALELQLKRAACSLPTVLRNSPGGVHVVSIAAAAGMNLVGSTTPRAPLAVKRCSPQAASGMPHFIRLKPSKFAAAYWSFGETKLVFRSHAGGWHAMVYATPAALQHFTML